MVLPIPVSKVYLLLMFLGVPSASSTPSTSARTEEKTNWHQVCVKVSGSRSCSEAVLMLSNRDSCGGPLGWTGNKHELKVESVGDFIDAGDTWPGESHQSHSRAERAEEAAAHSDVEDSASALVQVPLYTAKVPIYVHIPEGKVDKLMVVQRDS